MGKNILLVEDDIHITDLLRLHLHSSSYHVTSCGKGADAFDKMNTDHYSLIILDIMLPDINGIEVCRRIRERDTRTPILMLSSLSDETDKVLALELGADDYLTKPFGIFELMARTKALIRRDNLQAIAENTATLPATALREGATSPGGVSSDRAPASTPARIVFHELSIDREKRKVTIRDQRLELTPKEFDLLWLMAGCPGKTFSRHELLEEIWGFAFQEYEHTVTAHINRLRIKLERDPNKPEYILTTWGTGYRFAE
ncbi:MAG: response regulator transcription factor [Puia sp.]|nr:response regulator transcription factor [Puia sp.]